MSVLICSISSESNTMKALHDILVERHRGETILRQGIREDGSVKILVESNQVSSVILSAKGNLYFGSSVRFNNQTFCAEQAAMMAMLSNGEKQIIAVVSIHHSKEITPSCGRCLSLMLQMHPDNQHALTLDVGSRIKKLGDLLPGVYANRPVEIGKDKATIHTIDKSYTGVDVRFAKSVGFCAGYSAILQMISEGRKEVGAMVVLEGKKLDLPCGSCRELLLQLSKGNENTIILGRKTWKLKHLLPSSYINSLWD